MPHLHIFPISHFSEKARWALDHHGIAYERTDHVPGFHLLMIRRLGLKRTWVPVLEIDTGVVQGSGDIIDWADANGQGAALTPADAAERERVAALETRIDRDVGEALRRITYAVLLDDAPTTCELWTRGAPAYKRWLLRAAFPQLKKNVQRIYKLSPQRVAQAKRDLPAALDEIGAQLEGREWLGGDTFGRADIALAALLAPWTRPPEHPFAYPEPAQAELAEFIAPLVETPAWQHALKAYRLHR